MKEFVATNADVLCDRLAYDLSALIASSVGCFHLAVSGGETPLRLFRRLSSTPADLDWSKLHLWWVDERALPPQDIRSNYGQALRNWLQPAQVPSDHIHRIEGELGVLPAATLYQSNLAAQLPNGGFDLVMLGVGEDGHTASLFPGNPSIWSGSRALACNHPKDGTQRISLTLEEILRAAKVWFLVTGEGKRQIVAEVRGTKNGSLPAVSVAAVHPDSTWYLDSAAKGIPPTISEN